MADDDRGYRYGAPKPDLSKLNQGLNEPSNSRNANGGSAFPGRQPGETRQAYNEWVDTWWTAYQPEIGPLLAANPGREDEIQAIMWTFRASPNFTDDVYDALLTGGFNMGPSTPTGGNRRGGGGGGGGATKAQQYSSAEAAVRNRAGLLGLAFDDAAISSIARAVVDGNWSADQLDDYLVPAARNTNQAGFITATVNKVSQLAAQQLLNVSDATAREWAVKIASGEMDFEGVQSLLQAQASQRFGWAADRIAQGISVRDLLLPTRDRIAAELEMNPEDIDLMDDRWLGMVQTVGSDGVTRAATDSEAIMRARKLPEFAQTQKAGDMMATYALTLRDYFGG